MEYRDISSLARALRDNIGKVVVGKEKEIELILAAMLSGGHVQIGRAV